MRFGRRTRNWVAGHRLFGDKDLDDNGAVANAERNALLATEDYDGLEGGSGPLESAEVNDTIHAVDPTQRLLTALGRFQRQVVKAEKGLPQDEWCDECMNQLITGIEIAYDQDWPDVQQALTDTARVLHSYEQARQAEQCVPFLQDSYEILCLMVGDLIVDNVRSGVMHKWQERYRQAVEELAAAGIELVEDDEEEEFVESPAVSRPASAPAPAPPIAPVMAVPEEEADPFGDDGFDPTSDRDEAFFMTPEPLTDLSAEAEAAAVVEWEIEEADEPAVEEPALEERVDTVDPFEEVSQLPPLDEVIEEAEADAAILEVPVADSDPVETVEPPAAIAAQEFEEVGEDAYIVEALCEAPVSTPVEKPAPAAAQADPADALLQTIRQAYAAGNVADAKVFALQVAADMAKMEADRAEATRALKQRLLEENADAIAAGEDQVRAAETGVADAELQVQEREQDQGAKRLEIEALRTQSAEHETEIATLDEQIRQLQAQRQEEEQRLRKVQEDLERSLAEDSRMQTDIESLQDALDHAQQSLAAAQGLVARLREERSEEESALACAEDTVAQHQRAVQEIQRTIASITGKPIEATTDPAVVEAAESAAECEDTAEEIDDGQISLLEHLERQEADARTKGKAKSN